MVLCFVRIRLVIIQFILHLTIRFGVVFPFHQSVSFSTDGTPKFAAWISMKRMISYARFWIFQNRNYSRNSRKNSRKKVWTERMYL